MDKNDADWMSWCDFVWLALRDVQPANVHRVYGRLMEGRTRGFPSFDMMTFALGWLTAEGRIMPSGADHEADISHFVFQTKPMSTEASG